MGHEPDTDPKTATRFFNVLSTRLIWNPSIGAFWMMRTGIGILPSMKVTSSWMSS